MKENQYQDLIDVDRDVGRTSFGLMSNQVWHDDPKRLVFVLARYKFVARLLEGRATVLEVGCADAFGTRIVQQSVGTVTAIDFDPEFIQDAQNRLQAQWPLDLRVHDILSSPIQNNFDAAYSIDVMEHILPKHEERFVEKVAASINPNGTAIFGTPSLESQVYASKQSKAGHVNCKTGEQLKSDLERKFHNVFVFSMNDEVIHTGFYPMAHYLFAICCGVR